MSEDTSAETVRVAAVQFAVGTDRAANLATCLRMIDEAAATGAKIIVLPEFCNHLSWYTDRAAAHFAACREGDEFLTALGERAARHRVYLKTGVTWAHPDRRTTGTGVLHGPDGSLLARADKQVLMGAERDALDPADELGPVLDTPYGRVGMYACLEGVYNETARGLAVRGAQILLNSLNSFAVDEASLHVPVRAAENRVWVVAANKVGPLVPDEVAETVAAGLGIPVAWLHGAGESRIVAPDGTVVATAPRTGEAVVVADIDVGTATDKKRPDGTDVLAARRPELYGPIAAPSAPTGDAPGSDRALARVLCPNGSGHEALDDAARLLRDAVRDAVDLAVLPELFTREHGRADREPGGPEAAFVLKTLGAALHGGTTYAVCSLPSADGRAHVGYLLGPRGIVHRQEQLHTCARHAAWADRYADAVTVAQLPFGRVAIVVGDDTIYPEAFRLAVLAGAEIVAVPFTPCEEWELSLGLPERAAENRLNVVAAGRPAHPGGPAGAVLSLPADFTLWTPWDGPFTGRISHPDITVATGPATTAEIRPALAANRQVSRGTDLVDGRPWQLAGVLSAATPPLHRT
ncbi:carbon-nitrogen hydrolase family protein [Yinghuangia soli]|uniref:Carbon-nitrogen hydrolase family protein n=1 Tax=Yinghuangia soli TaxID=2908204 RepID=A0AA41Q717_9ACTN|nr:carbon-nitrogen hydrolase family protein [Yinghuangia soli]MCF2531549.1 carbon-nitrogen hydrolase family protein [Yinghuangia soli]